ncbi:MAG: hypothetical protein A2776_00930 [Candidatus Levybacteria bacterium RIFCSPHIGHO2_01_FULL_40_10]|nr:MAG: hypothetical protein A2776_00930 [Candidatus Levybacteria bacterium RIFCSPHIGHO2_01_FULL_40_10]
MTPDLPFPNFVVVLIFLWSLMAKGVALWRAANLKQRNWFVAILVINTVGIAELIYLFKFSKKPLTMKEIRSWFSK